MFFWDAEQLSKRHFAKNIFQLFSADMYRFLQSNEAQRVTGDMFLKVSELIIGMLYVVDECKCARRSIKLIFMDNLMMALIMMKYEMLVG